jgi:hypothetical protein
MAWFNIKNKKKKSDAAQLVASSSFIQYDGWSSANFIPFDGEKTPFELGTPFEFGIHYYHMRQRSWEAYLMNDVIQNAIKKYVMWTVGQGLKLQTEGLDGEVEKKVEDSFRMYAKSKHSSHSGIENLHELAWESFKNVILSGDTLCVIRYEQKKVTMEIIDGYYIVTPPDKLLDENIKSGVRVGKRGEHLGYYVKSGMNFEYIKAKNSIGQTTAWLMYGSKYKLSDVRGMGYLSAVLESSAKLDRYKEATIGSAEENSKIPYTIEHNRDSTGENPLVNQLTQSLGRGGVAPETTDTSEVNTIATKMARTTSKSVYNMPVGSTLKRHDATTDINFKDFFLSNIDIIYATIGIPAEVALDKFEGSYSSSRAALKSWEYSIMVTRKRIMTTQFYKPFYDFWLDLQVLENKINIPGYLQALRTNDYMTLEKFRACRFIGASVPHIDPLKEVSAERKKLGKSFDHVPLTSVEQSCEMLNTGDFEQVINKAKYEKSISNDFYVADDNGNSTTEVSGKPREVGQ